MKVRTSGHGSWRGAAYALLVCATSALVLSGCQQAPKTEAQPKPSLKAGVEQYREDEVSGRLQIQLTETSTTPLTVTYVKLHWDGFSRPPQGAQNYPLTSGVEVALPVPLDMPAVCDTTPQRQALVDVTFANAKAQVVPVVDHYGVLMRVWHRQCERQAVQRAIGLEFGHTLTRVGQGKDQHVLTDMVITRREWKGPITITDLRGTVVMTLNLAKGNPPVALAATSTVQRVPIDLRAARCDLHALGETKKPFSFVVGLRFGTGQRLPGDLIPDAAGKSTLWQVIKTGCGVP